MTKTIYSNFLGILTKKGNKIAAKKIVDAAFLDASIKVKKPIHILLIKLFLKLNSFVETKKVRVKRSTYLVPFIVTSFKRKSYLIIKWLMEVVRADRRRVPLSIKLSKEIVNVLNNSSSKVLIKRYKY